MPIRRPMFMWAWAVASAGCTAQGGAEPTPCERAAEQLARCASQEVPYVEPDSCGPAQARDARAILDEGCEALPPPDAKADGFWCDGWRGDVLRRLGRCELPLLFPDPRQRKETLRARYGRARTRHPIVLVHGFSAGPENLWGFKGIPEALGGELDDSCGPAGLAGRCYEGGGDGHRVYFAPLPPFERVQVRAETLAHHVDHVLDMWHADRVHLMAHSMGGLDGRDLIDRLGYGDRVASLTTIATVHHGSNVVDAVFGDAADAVDGTRAEEAANALTRMVGATFNEESTSADLLGVMQDLSERAARRFNETHRNDPRVDYVTWASVSRVPGLPFDEQEAVEACGGPERVHWHPGHMDHTRWLLRPTHWFAGHGTELMPNDGLAAVERSRAFPDPGIEALPDHFHYRGCIPADHMDQVNGGHPNVESGFDHVRFWRNAALDLVPLEQGAAPRWDAR